MFLPSLETIRKLHSFFGHLMLKFSKKMHFLRTQLRNIFIASYLHCETLNYLAVYRINKKRKFRKRTLLFPLEKRGY